MDFYGWIFHMFDLPAKEYSKYVLQSKLYKLQYLVCLEH